MSNVETPNKKGHYKSVPFYCLPNLLVTRDD